MLAFMCGNRLHAELTHLQYHSSFGWVRKDAECFYRLYVDYLQLGLAIRTNTDSIRTLSKRPIISY